MSNTRLRIPTTSATMLVLLLVTIATAVASAQSASTFSGDGTQYTLSHPSNGNCNFMSFPEEAKTKYAALNKAQFKSTTNCGRCAQVSCVDPAKCSGAAKQSEIVHIVDQCPECVRGDLDLSPEVFLSITGHQSDRVKIQWKFVDCPVRGNIQYCLKDGSNNFWTAIQPTNFLVGIKSMRVNGQDTTMVDSAYYFLRDGKSATQTDLASLKVTLTSVNGEVIEETISLVGGGCVDSKFQFSKDRAADSEADFNDVGATTQDAGPATQSTQAPTTAAPPTETPAPTTTTAAPTPSASETPAPRFRGSDEAGVVEAATSAPSTPSTPTSAPTAAEAGVVRQITTRSDDGRHSTSPVLLVLLVLACTCILLLVVLAIVVKHKRRLKRESEAKHDVEHVSDLPQLIVKQSSFEELETPSRRADIAYL